MKELLLLMILLVPLVSAKVYVIEKTTTSVGGGSGTVTQVDTSGLLSGGPITTTGTLTFNTGLFNTSYHRHWLYANATVCYSNGTNCPASSGGNSSWNETRAKELFVQLNGTLTTNKWCLWSGNDLDCTVDPITNNNQLSNGAGYITDGNTGWDNTYNFVANNTPANLTYLFLGGTNATCGMISGCVTGAITDDTSVPKNHLTNSGTLPFTWNSNEISEADGSTTNELQNIFQTVSTTSGTAPVADTTTDTLTLTAGSGITITGDSTTDTITIAATGGSGSGPTLQMNLSKTEQAVTATAPVNITGLGCALDAYANSTFTCSVKYKSAALTTGINTSVYCARSVVNITIVANTWASNGLWIRTVTRSMDNLGATLNVSSLNDNLLEFTGTIRNNGVANTCHPVIGTEVAASAITVQPGSYCTCIKGVI